MLRDVTLGVAAGDRIGVVGRNGDGKSTLLRLIAGVEEPDAGAVTRDRRARRGAARPGRRPRRARARSATSSSAAGPTTSGRPTRRSAPCSTGCSAASSCARFPDGLDTPIAPLSRRRAAARSRSPGCCSTRPSCCCSTSRRTTSTSRASTGSRAIWPRAAASMLVVTHDRWFLDAVCTAHVGGRRRRRPPVRGRLRGLRAGARRARPRRRPRARSAARRLLRKELAWLRRGPPARTSKPKFRIEAANALIADEPEPRDRARAAALRRRAARRQGARRRGRVAWPTAARPRAARRHLAARPGRPRRAGRRQRLGQDDADQACWRASWSPTSGAVERGADGAARAPLAGHRRDPRATCACSSRSRRSAAARRSATASEITAGLLCERFGFRGDEGAHARARPVRRRAPPAAADAAADGRAERAAARRADQRPRHRHAHRAGGPARRLAGDARGRQPRPLLRRARVRQRLRAHRRRRRSATCPAGSTSTSSCARARRGGAARPPPRRRAAAPPGRGRCAPRARRSPGSSARSSGSASARPRCTRQMAEAATDHVRLRELQAELAALAAEREAARGRLAGGGRGAGGLKPN